MAVFRETVNIKTEGCKDMNNITNEVNAVISHSGIDIGICHIFNLGSTGVVGTIEFEPGLAEDFPHMLHRIIPPGRNYAHEQAWHDGNGHSHLQASLVGPEITVPVEHGKIYAGTWQQVFHYEADVKPRNRQVIVTVIGE